MKKMIVSLFVGLLGATSFAFAPAAAADPNTTVCIHLIQAVQSIPNLSALSDQSAIQLCDVTPSA